MHGRAQCRMLVSGAGCKPLDVLVATMRNWRQLGKILRLRPTLVVAIALGSLSSLSFAADAAYESPEARRFSQTRITATQWRGFLKETQAKHGAVTVEYAQVVRIIVLNEAAVYFFTKPVHPAHRAVVRRSLVTYADKAYVHTTGYYAGSRTGFLAWMKLFQAEDQKLQERLKRRVGRGIRRLADGALSAYSQSQ